MTKSNDNLLPLAIKLAVDAHGATMNKDGMAYILHPLRLMMLAANDEARIVSILHDTLEDTDLTMDQVIAAGKEVSESGFSLLVLDALDCVTKREGEDYQAFLERIATNPLAIHVKMLDLYDNIDTTRLPELTEWDLQRTAKYHKAIQFMKKAWEEWDDNKPGGYRKQVESVL